MERMRSDLCVSWAPVKASLPRNLVISSPFPGMGSLRELKKITDMKWQEVDSFDINQQLQVFYDRLAKVDGDVVNLDTLKAANVVRRNMKRARIVLSGEISRRKV